MFRAERLAGRPAIRENRLDVKAGKGSKGKNFRIRPSGCIQGDSGKKENKYPLVKYLDVMVDGGV